MSNLIDGMPLQCNRLPNFQTNFKTFHFEFVQDPITIVVTP